MSPTKPRPTDCSFGALARTVPEIDRQTAGIASQRAAAAAASRKLSWIRLAAFGALAAGIFLAASGSSLWFLLLLSLPGLSGFAWAFSRHGKVLDRMALLEAATTLLEERRERLAGRRRTRPLPPVEGISAPPAAEGAPAAPPAGESGFDLEAGVLDDLDLLQGRRSLLGFLDATSTLFGARRLLGMLRHPLLDPQALRDRQAAVREAAARPALIDDLLERLLPLRPIPLAPAEEALRQSQDFAGRWILLAWASLAGTAAPVILVLTFLDGRWGPVLLLNLIMNLGTIGWLMKDSNRARDRFLPLGPLLDGLGAVREVLQAEEPQAPAWIRAAAVLQELERPGGRLRRCLRLLEIHDLGILFEAINILTLWELRILPVASTILRRHRDLLERATRELGEIEAILSLALPLAEQHGFILPEIDEGPEPLLAAEGLGHPLLEAEKVVLNDLRLGPGGPIAIITGSNMSGKSTLLKAVGVNLVLAGMGGPVQARTFRWTPMAVRSDINVRDSLDDGKSYFAVEVERVEGILRMAGEGRRLLGIFDEPFRGTNSAERQAIAMALIAHLRITGGLHLVATHDLAITRLEGELSGVRNLHFREEAQGAVMRFDYRLRSGPAPTRNAIRVLEARGYPPEFIADARARLARIESRAAGSDTISGLRA